MYASPCWWGFSSTRGQSRIERLINKLKRSGFLLFIHSGDLYRASLRHYSKPSHGQRRKTLGKCKSWKGGSSARNADQRGDHSMLMGPQRGTKSLLLAAEGSTRRAAKTYTEQQRSQR